MGKAKRLGLLGAVIAVMALVVGAAIPALGSSRLVLLAAPSVLPGLGEER